MSLATLRTMVPAALALLSLAVAPACVGADMDIDEEPIALDGEGAVLSLEWVILDGGEVISCVDAGASEIEIAVLGEDEERQRISCFGGYAVIDGLSAGAAFVEVSLVDPQGEHLVTTEVGEIDLQSDVTNPLGAIELGL